MALIACSECENQVSDKAAACPNCGAPIKDPNAPDRVLFADGLFRATRKQLIEHAVKAIQFLNWTVDSADEGAGLVSFTTGMTWGSWSGVSGSIHLEEKERYTFAVSGTAKQNTRGGQVIALNIGGEANRKVKRVIDTMALNAR